MKLKIVGLVSIVLLTLTQSFSQKTQKYWIEVDPSQFKITEQFTLDSVKVESKSIWLNAFTTVLSEEQKAKMFFNPLVLNVSEVRVLKNTSPEAKMPSYGDYIVSLNPEYLEELGLDGTGVIAGVIDAGFVNVDSGLAYQHLVKNNRILGYRDFILDSARVDFFDQQTKGDYHGANVLAYFGGYNPETKTKIGLATGASYYLARTENGAKEHLVEEDDWIEAIEWMYGNGVRLVNTSLGYSEFDDTTENHTIYDMNGKTTKISIAAQKAVEKGMVLVCSAGNSGLKPWRVVSAPGDAEGVITVGATKKDDFAKEGYSSEGPEFNSYIKPDISTYSDRGTSYSSPEMAGLVACILQKYPNLTCQQIKEALAIAGHLNPLPNNYIGYGVPDPKILFDYLAGKDIKPREVKLMVESDSVAKIKWCDSLYKGIVVFHKIDKVHVTSQLRISHKKIDSDTFKEMVERGLTKRTYSSKIKKSGAVIKLYRPQGVKFSTVVINDSLVEIEWVD
jgi:subtilisin family serine protease